MIVELNGIAVNYIQEGDGDTVFVLHGWGANIDAVRPIIDVLNKFFRVVALDLPGFGDSPAPDEPIDSFQYAEIVKQLIDYTGTEKVSLVGHSFGGKLSIVLSSKYPELVEKVVLIDSAGLIPRRTIKYHLKVGTFKILKKIWNTLFFYKDESNRLKSLYKLFGSDDYQASEGVMRKILVKVVNEDMKPLLKDIQAPTLLIWGDKDDATPLYQGKIMESEIEGSGLVIFEGAGHFSYVDDYGKFKLVLKSFFKISDEKTSNSEFGGA